MNTRMHKRSKSYSSEFVRVERLIPGYGYGAPRQVCQRYGVEGFDHLHHKPYAVAE